MAQRTWRYTGTGSQVYNFGVYHGEDSGHLMVHCNNKVVLVEFNVLDSDTFSFFIEEDLIELAVMKTEEGFDYDLKINKEIDTPINRKRKTEKRQIIKTVLIFIVTLAIILTTLLIFSKKQEEKKRRYKEQGIEWPGG